MPSKVGFRERGALIGVFVISLCGAACADMGLEPNLEDPFEGGDMTLEPDGPLNFGTASPVGDWVEGRLKARNLGYGNLRLNEVWLSDREQGAFDILTNPAPCTIEPNGQVQIVVGFLPLEAGYYLGSLSVSFETDGTFEITRALRGGGCRDIEPPYGECP